MFLLPALSFNIDFIAGRCWRRESSYFHLSLLLLLLLSRFSHVRLYATPSTAAHQAPLSLGFSRQQHWSGLPFPSPMRESENEVAQSCPTLSDPMDCSPHQAPLSMGFSRQECWSGVPLPSPHLSLRYSKDTVLKSLVRLFKMQIQASQNLMS